jgi:nucleoside-diphosphate-sugar epimerase
MKRVLVIGSEGYVGSQLVANIAGEVNVVACDLKTGMDYLDMQTSVLAAFDEILFFAGTSNVADAKMEPSRAIAENVVFPLSLLERIKPHTRLIYASTGSLLSKRDTSPSVIADEQRENAYDASKLSFDLVAKYMGKRVVGLRMGTVSGWSPKMRWHLIFNAMNRSAIEQGVVRVTNPSAMRSILFHDDLADRILEIMDDDQVQGLIPVASYSLTIGELAHEVAHAHKVPVAFGEDDGTYSFSLPTIPQLFSLAERCEHFKRAYETNY